MKTLLQFFTLCGIVLQLTIPFIPTVAAADENQLLSSYIHKLQLYLHTKPSTGYSEYREDPAFAKIERDETISEYRLLKVADRNILFVTEKSGDDHKRQSVRVYAFDEYVMPQHVALLTLLNLEAMGEHGQKFRTSCINSQGDFQAGGHSRCDVDLIVDQESTRIELFTREKNELQAHFVLNDGLFVAQVPRAQRNVAKESVAASFNKQYELVPKNGEPARQKSLDVDFTWQD